VIWCNNELWLFLLQAIISKDFDTFADITMKDSNQFHAVCLDTFPPNVYMNDTSHAIVNLIHAYNSASGKTKVSMEIYKIECIREYRCHLKCDSRYFCRNRTDISWGICCPRLPWQQQMSARLLHAITSQGTLFCENLEFHGLYSYCDLPWYCIL